MAGILVSWRSLGMPAALLAVGLGVQVASALAGPSLVMPPVGVEASRATETVRVSTVATDAPPPYDVVKALQTLGTDVLKREAAATGAHETWIPAAGRCVRPSAKQQAVLRARLAAWIDRENRDEQDDAFEGLELRVGCIETSRAGLIVDMSVDRTSKSDARSRVSRWWIVRVSDDEIDVVAERDGTAKDDWMEWANEGSLAALALADVDGDGMRDVVWTKTEHEGGASISSYAVSAFLSTTETSEPIVTMSGSLDAWARGRDLLLGMGHDDEHLTYRCVDPNLSLVRCPAGDRASADADRMAIAYGFAAMTTNQLPDRDRLAAELATLRVPVDERDALTAAVPETTAEQRAQRHVAQFVARVRPQDPLDAVMDSTHETAQNHFDAIRTELGDAVCEPSPLADADQARVTAWIGVQPRPRQAQAEAVAIMPACGPYVWATWETWTQSKQSIGVRHEVLLVLDNEITSVVAFELEATGDPTAGTATAQTSTFFRHGDAIVGAVIHYASEDRQQLLAISDHRIVAKRNGQFGRYGFDNRWADVSDNVIADASGHLWHATPSGLERVAPKGWRGHAARQSAIEVLERFEPAIPADYVRALRTLGAPATLLREVQALRCMQMGYSE